MNLTFHATTRQQQRSIPPLLLDLLFQFGRSESAGSGLSKLFFDKQARKRIAAYAGPLASMLNDHLNLYAVVGSDSRVVTVGHRLERIHRN